MAQYGYWVDLATLRLADGSTADKPRTWIQGFPFGEYDHPMFGKIKFTADKAKEVVANFTNNVRGTKLDIDYDHKLHSGEAAGWIEDMQSNASGLQILVEWTSKAWSAIQDGAYRYFSPEFADEWKHPKTHETHKNVLFGGGITNRPFLKDIMPINMSELTLESQPQPKEKKVDPKLLRRLLKLSEDATDEEVEAAAQAAVTASEKSAEDDKKDEPETSTGLSEEVITRLKEVAPGVTDVIKQLTDTVAGLQSTVQTQQAALQMAEVSGIVKQFTEPGSGNALPAALKDQLVTTLMEGDPVKKNAALVKLLSEVQTKGLVPLGEIGAGQGAGDSTGGEEGATFYKSVTKLMEDSEGKLSFADAVSAASAMDPAGYNAFRESSYAFKI
jgi:phage I-like protein